MGAVSLRAVATAVLAIASCLIPSTTTAQAVIRGTLYDDVTGLPLQGTVMLVDPNTDAAVVHTPTWIAAVHAGHALRRGSIFASNQAALAQRSSARPSSGP